MFLCPGKIPFLGLFLLLHGFLSAQNNERYARVRIVLGGEPIESLAALGIETDHGDWVPGQMLTTALSETELALVQKAGFKTKILIPDLQVWREAQNENIEERGTTCYTADAFPYATPQNYTYGSMGGYHTLDEMLAVLDRMAQKFPSLVKPRDRMSKTSTAEGRPLWYVKISDNPNVEETEPEVLYTALHHAREPNSLSQMLFYMWYLLENYTTDARVRYVVDNTELYFAPCVNPDGYAYNQSIAPGGGGMWRKNRRVNADGSYGVDLNRNYGYQWGLDNTGSSPTQNTQTYRGAAPFSEPETQIIRDFCLAHNFVLAQNYHTSGNLLIYPWAWSDKPADPGFVTLGSLFAKENRYRTGTTIETVGYRVNGDADDWMYATVGAWPFTPEIGLTGFWPKQGEIDGLNKANLWTNLATALAALHYGAAEDQSGELFSQLKNDLPFVIRRYGFRDGMFSVSLKPLTPNVVSVSSQQTFGLKQFEGAESKLFFDLAPDIKPGDEFALLLSVDNGFFTQTDTLRKRYVKSKDLFPLFAENGLNLNAWKDIIGWGITSSAYVSAPTSMTDSPTGNYKPYAIQQVVLKNPVQIPAVAQKAQLRFWARWNIEEDADYVQVLATGSDGKTAPLCGRYTEPGTGTQSLNKPVYDGVQNRWVEETIDLGDYIGQSIGIRFALFSDENVEFDGFYFDDLRIEYSDGLSVGTAFLSDDAFRLLPAQPNPAYNYTTISASGTDFPDTAILEVYNPLGVKILEQPVDFKRDPSVRLETAHWPAGAYIYHIRSGEGRTPGQKLIVR
jgi:carboxypeptidase T